MLRLAGKWPPEAWGRPCWLASFCQGHLDPLLLLGWHQSLLGVWHPSRWRGFSSRGAYSCGVLGQMSGFCADGSSSLSTVNCTTFQRVTSLSCLGISIMVATGRGSHKGEWEVSHTLRQGGGEGLPHLEVVVATKGVRPCPIPQENEFHSIHLTHLGSCIGQICHEDRNARCWICGQYIWEMVTFLEATSGSQEGCPYTQLYEVILVRWHRIPAESTGKDYYIPN